MTREDKDSLVEMLSKIPITETKGSLLSAIGKLLRVIDISESSIMIPTLLKDKCEFDAYEMLTLAKVLKASILGHNDLVEFYMSESSSPSLSASSTTSSSSSSSSTTPSLRSSGSERSSSSPSTPIPRMHLAHTTTELSSTGSSSSSASYNNNNNKHHLNHHQLISTNGDPDATVRLLLQIEQLKTFIPQVTGIFESIIELYKNSVDTYGGGYSQK